MLIGRTKTILDLRIGPGSVMKSGKVLWKGRTWQSAASWKTRRELTESGGGGNMSPMSKPRSAAMVIGEGICGQYHSTENRPGPDVVLWVVVIGGLLKN